MFVSAFVLMVSVCVYCGFVFLVCFSLAVVLDLFFFLCCSLVCVCCVYIVFEFLCLVYLWC